jgi:hypothetical protein
MVSFVRLMYGISFNKMLNLQIFFKGINFEFIYKRFLHKYSLNAHNLMDGVGVVIRFMDY